ncbi:MAG TPA: TetR/AcrR family transcriptional regulator [Gaiellaceae bacterium]|nr:TetR/AcrR family transcriptional regulator [Gaiellaceae bacterium]
MAEREQERESDTRSRILDVAERLVQTRGFNGFSYADIAAEVRVTRASLHYHFAGKAELGEALITRYTRRFTDALAAVDESAVDAPTRLDAYVGLYADVLRGQRMCLCGMLAAEFETLPKPMQDAVIRFFDESEAWLESVLEEGRQEGALQFAEPASEVARLIVSSLEGAMLLARPYGDALRFQTAASRLVASLARAAE